MKSLPSLHSMNRVRLKPSACFKQLALVTLAALGLGASSARAGTGIGSFPQINGGFEGETAGVIGTSSSIASNTVSSGWTIQTTGSATGAGPSISAAGGRSGPGFVTNYSASASRRLQSPTAAGGAIGASNRYIIQLYYRTSGALAATNFAPGISTSGTGNPNYIAATNLPGTSGVWTKWTTTNLTQAAGGVPTSLGIGVIRFSNTNNIAIDVDDFCIYPGTNALTTPPNPVASPLVSNPSGTTLTVGWTAPAGGVNGGGYLVVRSASSDPTAVPNVNGIYAVGNTINDGVGVPGTVAYIGTATFFVDSGLALNSTYNYRIYAVDMAFNYATGIPVSGTTAPTLTQPSGVTIAPLSLTTNAGSTVVFTSTVAAGDPPYTYGWFYEIATVTNQIIGSNGPTLTLNNVSGASAGNYQLMVSNAVGSAAAPAASLVVTGDPGISSQPNSSYGLLDGTVRFAVVAAGTSPTYQWYQFDDASTYTPLTNGVQPNGQTVVSGASAGTLTLTNLQFTDPTNFVVVVSNAYGSVTSSVASLLSLDVHNILTFWDFNGANFSNITPAPYYGLGTTLATNCTPIANAVVDPVNGAGYTLHLPNNAWGAASYPASGSNKLCGFQFNASTLGAKNITVSYDSRVSATASDYERLQYTTNGSTWTDFPASSTFAGQATTYYPFSYSLAGFPGVANNPNFGIRVVTEFLSTASYGIVQSNIYVGTANTYGTSGTITYDIVTISGDAITNNNTPPTISPFINTNTPDYLPLTLNFTVGDAETPAGSLTLSAVSLNSTKVNPQFSFGGSGANRTITITPNTIPDPIDAAPIEVTVTDGNGDKTVTWFLLTVTSVNQPPTSSLTSLPATNTLANHPITIPFTVSDDRSAAGVLTYSATSANNSVVADTNMVISGQGTTNLTLTITPAGNQVGIATLSVTVYDNDAQEARSTTAKFAVMVRPNTNVVGLDYFNYDLSGPLDTISDGYWQHLSGVLGQMQAGDGVATVDTLDNTENLQAQLLGAPYRTNSDAVLYSSFVMNLSDPIRQPQLNGTYFALFNDGSGVTGPYECRVLAATNGAAPGFYRLGINNFGADATTAHMYPQDFVPGTNYLVVTSLVLSNGVSTLWINPTTESSFSVTDPTVGATNNLFNISDFELRESGANAGSVSLSHLKIGTTFDSVFPSLNIQPAGGNVILNWGDPTLGIQAAGEAAGPYSTVSGATSPYTNNVGNTPYQFFRLGQ